MTTLLFEYGRLLTFVRSRIHLVQERGEEGMTTAEWVVLVAVVVAMAIAIGAIITTKVTDKANGISL
jgi:Flp pilus assembly pilin Flp